MSICGIYLNFFTPGERRPTIKQLRRKRRLKSHSEDTSLCFSALARGTFSWHIPKPTIFYLLVPHSVTSPSTLIKTWAPIKNLELRNYNQEKGCFLRLFFLGVCVEVEQEWGVLSTAILLPKFSWSLSSRWLTIWEQTARWRTPRIREGPACLTHPPLKV